MQIRVNRFFSDKHATISLIEIDHGFQCFGLEDRFQSIKVPGKTRIPAGSYSVDLKTTGGKHKEYLLDFPSFHKGMLRINGVPGFTDILIHIGNYASDTDGCLLLGANCQTYHYSCVLASRRAYVEFYKHVVKSAKAGELYIQFIDNDDKKL